MIMEQKDIELIQSIVKEMKLEMIERIKDLDNKIDKLNSAYDNNNHQIIELCSEMRHLKEDVVELKKVIKD